jgi:hypothetical protein
MHFSADHAGTRFLRFAGNGRDGFAAVAAGRSETHLLKELSSAVRADADRQGMAQTLAEVEHLVGREAAGVAVHEG